MTDVQEFLNSTPGISKFIFGGRSVTVIPIPPEPPHDHVIMAVYVDGLSVTLAATWEWDGYAWWSLDAPGGPARWGLAQGCGSSAGGRSGCQASDDACGKQRNTPER